MQRRKVYYRWNRSRIIRNKVRLLRRIGGEDNVRAWTNGEYGRLSKGKIHCSCYMCRAKSYDHISHRDAKHMISDEQQMKEYYSLCDDI